MFFLSLNFRAGAVPHYWQLTCTKSSGAAVL